MKSRFCWGLVIREQAARSIILSVVTPGVYCLYIDVIFFFSLLPFCLLLSSYMISLRLCIFFFFLSFFSIFCSFLLFQPVAVILFNNITLPVTILIERVVD